MHFFPSLLCFFFILYPLLLLPLESIHLIHLSFLFVQHMNVFRIQMGVCVRVQNINVHVNCVCEPIESLCVNENHNYGVYSGLCVCFAPNSVCCLKYSRSVCTLRTAPRECACFTCVYRVSVSSLCMYKLCVQ